MNGHAEHEERVKEKVRRMESGLDLWTGQPLSALAKLLLGLPDDSPAPEPFPPSAEALARMRAFEGVALAELD